MVADRTEASQGIDIECLTVEFPVGGRWVPAVDHVKLEVAAGETVGLVGESGSGKTMIGLSVLALTPPAARVHAKRLDVAGHDLLGLDEKALASLRGGSMSMIFQDPMTGLNPVRTIGSILVESIRRHSGCSRREARGRAQQLLVEVGVPAPRERLDSYPHQLSGGLRQRAMIALALANDPAAIVADEPTTALDPTIQAQVLQLLSEVVKSASVLLITHDLSVAGELCDRLVVIYAGRVVEQGPTRVLLESPSHPYTAGLLAACPSLGERRSMTPIEGMPPTLGDRVPGCRFSPRCPRTTEQCKQHAPRLTEGRDGTLVACWHPVDGT